VAISADGSVVVTAAFVSGQVHFWNADDGSLLGTIPRSTVDGIALSPDNSLLLVAEQGQVVELWSTRDRSLVASYPEDAQSYFTAVAFSADGSEFVTAGGDGVARVRSIDGTLVSEVRHNAAIDDAAFSPNGKKLATATEDGTAMVTDLEAGSTLATFTGHTGPVATVAFSPTGDLVATGGQDGVVRLWRPEGGAEVAALVGHQAPVNQVAFSPSGDTVLSASDDSTARIWSTAGPLASFPQASATAVPGAYEETFSTGGRYAAVTVEPADFNDPFPVETIDVATGEVRSQFPLGDDSAVPALSADGELTVTTNFDKTSIRRTSDGSVVAEVPITRAYDAAFDDSGHRLLVVGESGQAGVYDAGSGKIVTELEGHDPSYEVVGAAFSPDASRVLTASVDGTARIWDATSGKQLLQVDAFGPPHKQYEQHATLALSPDGKVLATSAGYEDDAQLWDARTGERLATLEGVKSGGLADLAFSDDGRFIVTAPLSGSVRLWDGHSGRLLASVTDSGDSAGAAIFTDGAQGIALVGSFGGQESMAVLDCAVCGDLDSLVDLAKTRVTRELTASEKATYLSGD
jgi:WD40 repeat protein